MIHPLHARRALQSLRVLISLAVGLQVVLPTTAVPTFASSVTSITIAGTTNNGGNQYARTGTALTLTVATSADTQCLEVLPAFVGDKTSATPRSSWTFSGTAGGTSDGPQTITATAYANFNKQGTCSGQNGSASTSYILDNTGPSVTAQLSPAPNAAGWNKANVNIGWIATDSDPGWPMDRLRLQTPLLARPRAQPRVRARPTAWEIVALRR